jgi:hypothetical protein
MLTAGGFSIGTTQAQSGYGVARISGAVASSQVVACVAFPATDCCTMLLMNATPCCAVLCCTVLGSLEVAEQPHGRQRGWQLVSTATAPFVEPPVGPDNDVEFGDFLGAGSYGR